MKQEIKYSFYQSNDQQVIQNLGKEKLLHSLKEMLRIRHFELRGEAAYSQGKVGGFYHSYMGQEAIQVGCLAAAGPSHWYTTTYRCHALALLLGASPNEMMAELYGRKTGNAGGKGGSMHLYAERLLGGLAIVGGHVPIALGAAFSIQYLNQVGLVSFCFLGEGAVAQGAVHESLNIAALWNLPLILVIENNQWGMGTAVSRAICAQPIAEHLGRSYEIPSYTLNGMDFFDCYAGFHAAIHECLSTSRPIIIECVTERFRGHSISDPGVYRTKEALQKNMEKDPIVHLKNKLFDAGILSEDVFQKMDKEAKEEVLAAMKFADESPWPDLLSLEEGVFAPEEK